MGLGEAFGPSRLSGLHIVLTGACAMPYSDSHVQGLINPSCCLFTSPWRLPWMYSRWFSSFFGTECIWYIHCMNSSYEYVLYKVSHTTCDTLNVYDCASQWLLRIITKCVWIECICFWAEWQWRAWTLNVYEHWLTLLQILTWDSVSSYYMYHQTVQVVVNI